MRSAALRQTAQLSSLVVQLLVLDLLVSFLVQFSSLQTLFPSASVPPTWA